MPETWNDAFLTVEQLIEAAGNVRMNQENSNTFRDNEKLHVSHHSETDRIPHLSQLQRWDAGHR
jgi:hypothetical protein